MHEHHPGCEHSQAHEQHHQVLIAHAAGLCCAGQCQHPEHQPNHLSLELLQRLANEADEDESDTADKPIKVKPSARKGWLLALS